MAQENLSTKPQYHLFLNQLRSKSWILLLFQQDIVMFTISSFASQRLAKRFYENYSKPIRINVSLCLCKAKYFCLIHKGK